MQKKKRNVRWHNWKALGKHSLLMLPNRSCPPAGHHIDEGLYSLPKGPWLPNETIDMDAHGPKRRLCDVPEARQDSQSCFNYLLNSNGPASCIDPVRAGQGLGTAGDSGARAGIKDIALFPALCCGVTRTGSPNRILKSTMGVSAHQAKRQYLSSGQSGESERSGE